MAALDVGEAYTGVAISDPGATLARPLEAVPAGRLDEYLRDLLAVDAVTEIVVGVPKTLGGEVGFQAIRVLERVEALEATFPGVRFVRWDERLTTRVARVWMEGSKKSGRKRRRGGKERVDHLAAAAMLQEYLDRREAVAPPR